MECRYRLSGCQLVAGVLVGMLMAGCSPVVLNKPDAVSGPTPPPPTEPVYSIDFTVRNSYQPNTLRVVLNGKDITQRYSGAGYSGATEADDFVGIPPNATPSSVAYVQTVSWTASCIPGSLFCADANFTYTFGAYGLGFTCAPTEFDTNSPTNPKTPSTYAQLGSSGHPTCMNTLYSLRLSPSSQGGTVTVELGVPAPAGGLAVEIIPDPLKAWLSINNGAVFAPATLNIPIYAQRGTFSVTLLPNNLPAGQQWRLYTYVTLKARGFAPTVVPVSIAR